jgi:hypothetical protein
LLALITSRHLHPHSARPHPIRHRTGIPARSPPPIHHRQPEPGLSLSHQFGDDVLFFLRQHMSAYVSIRQHPHSICQHTSAYVSNPTQHTSAYVSIRQVQHLEHLRGR